MEMVPADSLIVYALAKVLQFTDEGYMISAMARSDKGAVEGHELFSKYFCPLPIPLNCMLLLGSIMFLTGFYTR